MNALDLRHMQPRACYMQVFNSRMCQLVLGAGAMQVSGLRSITAKHLALSSQCLSVFMALHPLLKSLFTASLPAPQRGLLLPELDRLLQVCLAALSPTQLSNG